MGTILFKSLGNEEVESQYSILMIGGRQAGKSTFIEFVKNYADPEHDTGKSLIGKKVESTTNVIRRFTIKSDLPAYEVYHDDSDVPIDTEALSNSCTDMDNYTDAISSRKLRLRLLQQSPEPKPEKPVTIQFLDTPAVSEPNCNDVEHAKKIIDEIAKTKTFNLIVVFISIQAHLSVEAQMHFRYYSNVIHALQGHHSNVIFLYTHVDYCQLHHSNTEFNSRINRIHKVYSGIFRGLEHTSEQELTSRAELQEEEEGQEDTELYPMYTIDLDLKPQRRSVIRCMQFNTLRHILLQAVTSPPVVLDPSPTNLQRIQATIDFSVEACRRLENKPGKSSENTKSKDM